MSSEIGELLEEPGEVRGLWRIPDCSSLSQAERKNYFSPKFLFLDACWRWEIDFEDNSEWIGLHLRIMNCDSPKEVRYSFSIRNASGKEERSISFCGTFSQKESGRGTKEFLKVSNQQTRGTELAPSDVLTISFTLKSASQRPSEGSLFRRLWNMSLSLRNILSTQERSDVTLKLKDGEISAHRVILESRSPVFNRMFGVDLRESQTGEVNIEDATEDAFQVALYYAYGGDPKGLSCENVCEVYKIAHKYEFEDLRKFCAKFMRETLCVETFFDVLEVVDLYQETALNVSVRDFFAENKSDICKSMAWKKLKKDNPSIVIQVLEWVLDDVI